MRTFVLSVSFSQVRLDRCVEATQLSALPM
jgi:hypothetical protein